MTGLGSFWIEPGVFFAFSMSEVFCCFLPGVTAFLERSTDYLFAFSLPAFDTDVSGTSVEFIAQWSVVFMTWSALEAMPSVAMEFLSWGKSPRS